MFQSIMLFIAAGCLFLNVILSIIEIIKLYNANLYAAQTRHISAHKTCKPAARYVEIDGIRYSVDWIIKEGRYYNEEKENKRVE